jgi:small subunit ribosomal protein S16
MLMMRLQRIGRRNEAHFKIVVIEKTKGPKSQKYVDIIGSYNPKMGTVTMNEEKVQKHLAHGVQPSDTVYNMLVTKGLVEGRKRNNLPQKSPVIDLEKIAREKEEAEAKATKLAEAKAAAEVAEAEAKAAKEAAEAEAKAAKEAAEAEPEAPAEEEAEAVTEEVSTEETPAPEAEVVAAEAAPEAELEKTKE